MQRPRLVSWQRRVIPPVVAMALALLVSLRPQKPLLAANDAHDYDAFCTLIGLPYNSFTLVPPPPEADLAPLFAPAAATINVTYVGFTAQAQAAFQRAVDIWKTQLTSAVTINVRATFSDLGGGNVLGQAGYTTTRRNFANAPFTNTWFPIPIADALTGTDNNPGPPDGPVDIDADFNSAYSNWYFGTDGLTPAGQYDFVSVVLHELGHGVGFAGSMNGSNGLGTWGSGTSFPFVYDRFVINGSNQSLIDTTLFQIGTASLGAQMASDNVFWSGANAVAANSGVRPRLYAPTAWLNGSSIDHLDDDTFPPGNINSLMTHALGTAEAIHNPGPVTRGILRDSGWTVDCSLDFTLSATAVIIGQAGGTGVVGVTAPIGCAWTATSNASFVAITGGASGSGNGTVTYSASANSSGTRTGTLTIAGQTFTLTQGPTLAVDHTTLDFGAINAGGALSSVTAAQTVRLTFAGGAPAWTATPTVPASSVPWLQITAGAGTGNGEFTVGVIGSPSLPPTGSVATTIQVVSGGAVNSPALITVRLRLFAPATTAAPFGSFDTPAGGVNVQGSIAVTGWALDDIEVDRVEIWRDLATNETTVPVNSPGHPGHGKIFIANALFVPGARPDVEALHGTRPFAYRAGWGYLLLTWGLFNQGNGSFTLYAFAFDKEGKVSTLGTKAITASNASAVKPFGAIDTPAFGQTVTTSFWNFGWALTPRPHTGDLRTCTIVNGNVSVAIDGGPLIPVTYGGARTDVAGSFPGFSNASAAGGAYFVDISALANGTHSIGWFVVDNCGRADGIGSRFFTVAKSSLTPAGLPEGGHYVSGDETVRSVRLQPDTVEGPPDHAGGPPRSVDDGDVGRVLLEPSLDAPPAVQDFRSGARDSGLEVRDPQQADAPRVAPRVAQDLRLWAWDSGLGTRDTPPADVRVRALVEPSMRMAIDTPQQGATIEQPVVIAGWALDLAATEGSGIDAVHVWAYPAAGGAPTLLGVADIGDARSDVATTYGAQFERSSFNLAARSLAPGTYDIVVYAHRAATGSFDGAQIVRVTIP